MNRKMMLKTIILAMIMILLLPLTLSCTLSAEKVSAQTLSGYIMDTHCFLMKPDPGLDSKKCLQMPACAATGYGIAVKQDDGAYKFYVFDGSFAPEASDAQLLAADLVNATIKNDHIYITVTGILSGDTIKADGGTQFKVIKVSSMSESNEQDG